MLHSIHGPTLPEFGAAFLLEKALYEIGYELNNRPAWLRVPLREISSILAGRIDGK